MKSVNQRDRRVKIVYNTLQYQYTNTIWTKMYLLISQAVRNFTFEIIPMRKYQVNDSISYS